jgi:hypothetical protein
MDEQGQCASKILLHYDPVGDRSSKNSHANARQGHVMGYEAHELLKWKGSVSPHVIVWSGQYRTARAFLSRR